MQKDNIFGLPDFDEIEDFQGVTSPENLEATDALFARMVDECHRRGMRVILDGVFNHCGSFNKWMDRERIYENDEDIPQINDSDWENVWSGDVVCRISTLISIAEEIQYWA